MIKAPSSDTVGILCAVSAYTMWSLATIYFKALPELEAFEILAHRIIGSSLLTLALLILLKRLHIALSVIKRREQLLGLCVSTVLIAVNWALFIWSISEGLILSASLGYYINPLVNILLGFMFLGERLGRAKLLAAAFCVFAVMLEIINFGKIPYVALILATSFGLYGLVRKKLSVDSLVGLGVETSLLAPIALIYLMFSPSDEARFIGSTVNHDILLLLAGPLTMIPLLCFSAAANRISLSLMGFIQYIAPTGMFLLAIFVYGEHAAPEKILTFVLVWLGLGFLIADTMWRKRKGQFGY